MEVLRLEVFRYSLTPLQAPNRLSAAAARSGVLLRVHFRDLPLPGHADLFPWPELGDEALAFQLDALKSGTPCALGASSLAWAYYEARARAEGRALLNDADYVSHTTLVDRTQKPGPLAKLKVTASDLTDPSSLVGFFDHYPETRWRLDFNGLLETEESAKKFWAAFSTEHRSRIDWLEDPFTETLMRDPKAIAVFRGTPVALDRGVLPLILPHVQTWVVKPVYFSPDYLFAQVSAFQGHVAFTSNMDHPLGQLIALHVAQRAQTQHPKKVIAGGLLTHDLYSPHAHSAWVTQSRSCLKARTQGAGWGLAEKLDPLSWEPLA
ncbi:MAG: hypothetical protein ACLGG7_02250 [Bacteriovoracia bacterium]